MSRYTTPFIRAVTATGRLSSLRGPVCSSAGDSCRGGRAGEDHARDAGGTGHAVVVGPGHGVGGIVIEGLRERRVIECEVGDQLCQTLAQRGRRDDFTEGDLRLFAQDLCARS